MTVVSPQAAEERSTRSVWLGAAITSAVIAAGTAVAVWTVPDAPTPSNVAESFIHARFTGDFRAAWDLLCRETRSQLGDFPSFAEQVARTNLNSALPSDIDISAREVMVQPTTPLKVNVGAVVTSEERNYDRFQVWLELLEQDGQFRVCDDGPWVR
jgi:hypothetical protein